MDDHGQALAAGAYSAAPELEPLDDAGDLPSGITTADRSTRS